MPPVMILGAEIVALIAAGVAVFAAVLAVRATALVARTVIAGGAESRSRPVVRVLHGRARRDIGSDTREYEFVVAVSNPGSSNREYGAPTLRVTYRTRANFLGAVDLSSSESLSVAAGQAREVTLRFATNDVIPRHCRIDAYTLLLTDTTGNRQVVDASLPAVLQADSDGEGPRTWGRD